MEKEAISSFVHKMAIQKSNITTLLIAVAKKVQFNLLQGINQSAVVNGRRVDYFINKLSVTVGVGCGDMNEDLQVLHSVGQCQHFLGGEDIQLHCIPEKFDRRSDKKKENDGWIYFFPLSGAQVLLCFRQHKK